MQGSQSAAHGSALPFAALNGALATDVACVVIPPGVHVDRPLHVLYLSTGMPYRHGIARLGTKQHGVAGCHKESDTTSLPCIVCLGIMGSQIWAAYQHIPQGLQLSTDSVTIFTEDMQCHAQP